MANPVQEHYQSYPYPRYPLIASVRRCNTYALNLQALWCRFNGVLPPLAAKRILIAGSGTFAPYPWGVANPGVVITALDLSERSLRRARWHCLLHGQRAVEFRCGDLTDPQIAGGTYGMIDSYGVLHHLDDPLAGLKALEKRLAPGGIIRIMLYSRYARRDEESIRRAFRLLGVDSPAAARRLLRSAPAGSRLAHYMTASDESRSVEGLADALLHPRVHTYRIDELLELIAGSTLKPLLFAHQGARENLTEEINRLRSMEKERLSPGNFIVYLGRRSSESVPTADSLIQLNPCLAPSVGIFSMGSVSIPPRIGSENPLLTGTVKRFLRRFVAPVRRSELSRDELQQVAPYKRLLFLMEYSSG